MSFMMSGTMLAINNGIDGNFFKRWMRSWAIGFVVAYPTASIIVPFSRRWVESSPLWSSREDSYDG